MTKPTNCIRTLFISLFILGCVGGLHSQLTVDSSISAENAVQDILMGGGVEAANIVFSGNETTQIGYFECNSCGINISSGVIIGTGAVTGAVGPNNSGNFSAGPPTGNDYFGDPDLAVLAGNTIHNAAILEFDFVPTGDNISFNFVFSSEEYPEYVNSVNDAFGFFLSGPGISGPFTNSAVNIALIPGTTDPVTINSVNFNANSAYYVRNHLPNNTSYSQIHDIQADGFTTVLTAHADVICGETYHIKIAIGDASDGSWDSWVFLQEGSFSTSPLDVTFIQPTIAPGMPNTMYEFCGEAPITFYRPPCVFGDYTFDVTYSGTFTNGVDAPALPTTITIPDGENEVTIYLNPYDDGEDEGVENLILNTQLVMADGEIIDIELELFIYDHPQMSVTIDYDQNDVCPDIPVTLTAVPTNTLAGEFFLWSTGETTQSIVVSSPVDSTFYLVLDDGCNYSADAEFTLNVLERETPLQMPDSIFYLCTGISSGPIISGGYYPLTIVYDETLLEVEGGTLFSNAPVGVTTVEVTDFCGNSDSFEVVINVCDTTIPNIFTPNNDQHNPTFEIKGIQSFPNSSLTVYNRWGKVVYENHNYNNDWSANEQEDGTYYYIFRRSDGLEYSGYIVIVR
ncbi:MAG TPA: choice-of-anchor L domain-containing protein [Flavobacteriales bacterium]